jgi:hypothetical protein
MISTQLSIAFKAASPVFFCATVRPHLHNDKESSPLYLTCDV